MQEIRTDIGSFSCYDILEPVPSPPATIQLGFVSRPHPLPFLLPFSSLWGPTWKRVQYGRRTEERIHGGTARA